MTAPTTPAPNLLPPAGRPPGARMLAGDDIPLPLPRVTMPGLLAVAREAGITGRGGAGYPLWRKLAAVAAHRRPVVVGNGAEGEPASDKDLWLLRHRPHLVLDGLSLVAGALDARDVVLVVPASFPTADVEHLALTRHRTGHWPAVRVTAAPPGLLSGEATATASWLGGGPAVPRTRPPHLHGSGVNGRPTLVQNVETLAHLALAVRHGAAWYRERGTPDEPGTLLMTVGGAVAVPGVVEVEYGLPLARVLAAAGGPTSRPGAVLVGGYHGGWLPPAALERATVSAGGLARLGAALGAGVLVVLPADRCGLIETARVLRYLAAQSAGRCGPCLNGLPRLAGLGEALATRRGGEAVVAELHRIAGLVDGRGACRHPDGTVRLLRSALDVFAREVAGHTAGVCTATSTAPVLPVPVTPESERVV